MILGKMFQDRDSDGFFAHGIGAMSWDFDIVNGKRCLWFLAPLVPPPYPGSRAYDLACIYTETDGEDWTHPGPVQGWDGDLVSPTFSPSIWLFDRKGWHGYIRNGNLETA